MADKQHGINTTLSFKDPATGKTKEIKPNAVSIKQSVETKESTNPGSSVKQ